MKYFAFAFLFSILFIGLLLAADIYDQARELVQKGKVDEALTLLRDYDKNHPNDVDLHEMIQRILTRHGRREEALTEYKQRYEKDPTGLNGYLYVRLLEVPSEREKEFRTVIEKDPKSVWGHYGLANALMDEDKLQEGVDAATEALTKVSEPAQLHYILARIYRRMKDYKNAAEHIREFYRLDPTEDHFEDARAYEWLEVAHTESPDEKFQLAKEWLKKYKDATIKSDASDDATTLSEVAFLYADNGSEPATVKELVTAAMSNLAKQTPPISGDDKELYLRTKGALMALQAWYDATAKNAATANKHLKEAAKVGSGPEMFYFSALTNQLLGKKEEALKNAIRAGSYPPVYPRAKELAANLWKEVHGSEDGIEAALHQQRQAFGPQRKERVLSQMIGEKFEPFEMSDTDSKKFTEKDLSGKIVLMNFWAVWCPPCREELPHWNQFYAAHKSDPDLFFAAVGDEPWETIQNYMKNHNYSFPVYRNEKYWEQFDVEGIPTMVIIDPAGKIRFRNVGFEEGMEYAETLQWQINAVRNR